MTEIGHNKPPEPLTARAKLERIQAIVEREDLTAAQKCIGVGIVVKANRDGVSEVKTRELQQFASAKDRETVFRATATLHSKEVIEKANRPGQSGRYNVLPARVVEAITEAYRELKTGRAEPDGMDDTEPVGSHPTSPVEAVGSQPTGRDKPVGSGQTGQVQSDQPRGRTRARIEPPSGVLPLLEDNTPQPPKNPTPGEALEAWKAYNDTALKCGLPQAAKFTPDRQRKILGRLRDYGLDGWKRALGNIEKSAHLTGSNDRNWRADLEFICQAKSFARLHDGGYGNGRHVDPPAHERAAAEEFTAAIERARLRDEEEERCRKR
jgi:hypothetical protein